MNRISSVLCTADFVCLLIIVIKDKATRKTKKIVLKEEFKRIKEKYSKQKGFNEKIYMRYKK